MALKSKIMKKTIIFCSLIISFIGCTKVRENQIDFSFESGWDNDLAFSIKIEKSGKAFLARNRRDRKYFQKQIGLKDLKKLDCYIDTLLVGHFESKYEVEDVADLSSFCLIIQSKNGEKKIYVYGQTAPKELYRFLDFMLKFRDDSTFIAIDSTILFKSAPIVWNLPFPIKPVDKQ